MFFDTEKTNIVSMKSDIAVAFLRDYMIKTAHIFDEYMEQKVAEAASVGSMPEDLIQRTWELAKRGKKVRGALVLLGYLLGDKKEDESILRASLSIEILHSGLLIHDDIMDNDDKRRNLPSLHTQFADRAKELNLHIDAKHFGISMGIASGDATFYYAMQLLLRAHFQPKPLLKAAEIFSDYIIRVCYGQVLDITNTSKAHLTAEDILQVLKYKTAEYTGVLPLLLGITLADCEDNKKIEAIREYGLAFGWAFQIQDDILGVFGKEEKTGKPVGSDIREGKNTLMMQYALKHSTAEDQQLLKHALGNKNLSQKEVEKVLEILKSSGAYQHTIDAGWNYVEKGKSLIPQITKNKELADILDSLIYFMMERTM